MSGTTSAPSWGARAIRAGVLALLLTSLAAIALAPRANAEFTLPKCGGAEALGRGASFARDAHTWFNGLFKAAYCPGAGVEVAYDAAGSGAGRTSVKVRNDTPRFGMTDDPPSPLEVEQMNAGVGNNPPASDVNPNDNGQIHVIPAAVGAVAPLVNFPNNCNAELLNDPSRTVTQAEVAGDATKKALLRVRFNKAQYEKVWAQGDAGAPAAPFVNWDDVFPELQADADCDVPIIRVVRFDESGTTFAVKDYLNHIVAGRGWLTKYATDTPGVLTREWPGAEFGTGGQCTTTAAPGKKPDNEDHLTSGCANGNGALVQKLVEVDGSIGYSDISTARTNSTTLAVNPNAATPPDKYWTQVQNGSEQFTEPTANPNGFRIDGAKGANCANTTFVNVPGSTLGSWSAVSGVNSPAGFGICTMTYGLVFDDNATVWGNTPAEEAKARTVKDYWENIVSQPAQDGLSPADYAALPASILAIVRAGVKEIGWNKAGGGPGPGGGGGGGSKPSTGTPGGGGTVPISNKFSIPRTTISSAKGSATFSVKLPGAGKLDVKGSAKSGGKKINVGHVVLTVGKAGTYSVTLKPTGAAKKILREKGKLKVSLTFTFSPNGGAANTSVSSVTLKLVQKG
jgi:ABC-type phosphate transport system substrate-binding protein